MRMAVHGRFGDLESFLAADILFHRTLLEASGNDMLVALTTVHAEVAQAVQAGDPTHAQRATRNNAQRATSSTRRRGDERRRHARSRRLTHAGGGAMANTRWVWSDGSLGVERWLHTLGVEDG